MNQPTSPDPSESRKLDNDLPPSSRWRHIPEPEPLLIAEARIRLTPKRIAMIATGALCTVTSLFLFLKGGHSSEDSQPAPQRHAIASVSTDASPRSFATASPTLPRTTNETPIATAAPSFAAPVLSADDRKIDQVLRSVMASQSTDHTATAQILIKLLPTLSKRGQLEAAQHIANLIPDSDYQRVMPLWLNTRTDADVLEVIGNDLANRDPKVMLPVMLEAVRQHGHPFHDRALQTLELFLDANHGDNVAKWDDALNRYLSPQMAANHAVGR